MKDSGVEWIGEIPEEWSIRRMKNLFFVISGATPSSNADNWDGEIIWITPADYKTNDKYIAQGKRNLSVVGYNNCSTSLVPVGSLIFSKRAPIGTVAINAVPLCTNQGCLSCVKKNEDIDTTYYYYVLSVGTEHFDLMGSGTTFKEISASTFSNCSLPFPEIADQHRIADYLDAKCAEIDKVVEKTRGTIEEYKKLKQSIITETVTKGLNPDAEMKDSGIPWIGKIPVEWSIERLQWHLREINHSNNPVQTRQILSLTNKLGVIPYETKGNIGNKSKEDYSDYKLAYPDTIVVNSMNVIIGSVGISNYFGCVSPVYYVFAPETGNNVRFLNYIFQTTGFQKELRCYANGILEIRLRVSSDKILKRGVAIPSVEEQKLIVSFLDAKCAELDSIIEKKEQLIEELGSYKKSLIYEYVTGKKEVQT